MGKSEDMMGNSQQPGLAEAVLIVTAGEKSSRGRDACGTTQEAIDAGESVCGTH